MIRLVVLHNELECFTEDFSGLSLFIEAYGKKILFDTSFSDSLLKNASTCGIEVNSVDYVVLSHGHWDHTDGLKNLYCPNATLVAHPGCFERKLEDGHDVGSPVSLDEARKKFKIVLSSSPYKISKDIVFLGEVPRMNDFESKNPVGVLSDGSGDYVRDDSALVINSNQGLVIITGCSHSGICNIIDYSKKVMGNEKIHAVIGGFHLFNDELTDRTVEFFKNLNCKIYPMHCLSEYAFDSFLKIGAKRIHTLQEIRFTNY